MYNDESLGSVASLTTPEVTALYQEHGVTPTAATATGWAGQSQVALANALDAAYGTSTSQAAVKGVYALAKVVPTADTVFGWAKQLDAKTATLQSLAAALKVTLPTSTPAPIPSMSITSPAPVNVSLVPSTIAIVTEPTTPGPAFGKLALYAALAFGGYKLLTKKKKRRGRR